MKKGFNKFKGIFAAVVLALIASLLSLSALAAATSGTHTPIDGVTVSVSSATDNSMTDGAVTVTAKGSAGIFGYGASAKTATITVSNDSGSTAKISFDWTATSVNQLTIDGAVSVKTSDSFSKTLASGEYFSVTITTGENGTVNKFVMSNFALAAAQASSKVTFEYDSSLGTVKVDGTEISNGSSVDISSSGAVLDAQPIGSTFLGWVDTSSNRRFSPDSSCTFMTDGDTTVKAAFASAGAKAWFVVDGVYWTDDLNTAAELGSTIVLAADGTLPSGGYTIQVGDTLLIPFDESGTISTTGDSGTSPIKGISQDEVCSFIDAHKAHNQVFRQLTLAPGAVIHCYGTINVNGQRQYDGQPYTGTAAGWYGKLILGEEDPNGLVPTTVTELEAISKQVIIYSGGKLHCYGYITGSGGVEVQSGGEVRELLQICDWPGGSNASEWMTRDANEDGISDSTGFLLSQYYVQNIESPFFVQAGANCYAEAVLTVTPVLTAKQIPQSVAFIGSSGLLQLTGDKGLVRVYDVANDRVNYHCLGNFSLGNIKIQIEDGEASLDSADYILPLPQNMTICLKSGAVGATSNDFSLLPGAELIVEKGATLTCSGTIYLWDYGNWGCRFFSRYSITPNEGYSWSKTAPKCAILPYVATLNRPSPNATTEGYNGLVRGYITSSTLGYETITQHYYVATNNSNFNKHGKMQVDGTLVITGNLRVTGSKRASVVGSGVFEYTPSGVFKALTASYTTTAITTAAGIGNLSGLGTNQPFSAGTYYGLGSDYSNYWYQRQITPIFQNCAGGTVSGGKLTVTNGITGYIVSGGAFTITLPSGYSLDDVSADNGWTVSGEYTITGGEADRTTPVTVTVSLTHVPGTTATCTADQLCTVCNTVLKEALGHEYGWAPVETNGTNGTKYVNHLCCGRCEDLLATVDLQYRLDDYIWMNAIVDLVKAGSITVSDGVSLVEVSDTQYYLVRKVVAKELTTVFTAELAINGITEPFTIQLGFSAFDATLPDGHVHKSLVAAMLNYGKAADDYFEDGTNFSSSENVFTGDDAPVNFRKKQHEALNNYNGVQLKTANASVSFANCLGLGIYFHTTGEFALSEGDQIVQVGLLVGMGETYLSDADLGMLKVDDHAYDRAYILYDLDETFEFSNKPNYGSDKVTLVNGVLKECPDINISTPICIDLTHDMYTQRMALRPYVVIKHADGTYTNLYGEQYLYGLEAYCASVNANGKTVQSRNLVYYAWNYAKLAATTNFN